MPVVTGSVRHTAPGPNIQRLSSEDGGSFDDLRRHFNSWFLNSLGPEAADLALSPQAQQGFATWSTPVQNKARAQYGKQLDEILSLLDESDEELFVSSWISFAGRLERAGKDDVAGSVYALLAKHPEADLARRRLASIEGGGEFGLRVERLMRSFNEQAFDPSLLGGMVAATTAFQGLRLVGLSRLLSAEASWLTRGKGAQVLASALGMSGEVPAFLFTSKGLAQAMGRPQDWKASSLAHEGAALGISLLYLKGFGALGQKGASWAGGSVAPRVLPNLSAFGGLYLGRQTEAALGLRPQTDSGTALTESLAFLLQLKVGGEAGNHLMGRSWREALQEVQVRAATQGPRLPRLGIPTQLPALAGISPRFLPQFAKEPAKGPTPSYMLGGDGPEAPAPLTNRDFMRVMLSQNFPLPPEASLELKGNYAEILDRIVENIHKTPGLEPNAYFEKLSNSRISDVFNNRDVMTSRIEVQDYASTYWRNMKEMDPLHRASGSLYDHLMQEALERTYREGERQDWDALIKVAGWTRRVRHLDSFFRERGWDQRYAFQDKPEGGAFAQFQRRALAWYRSTIKKQAPLRETYAAELENMPLSAASKLAVTRYLDTFIHGREAKLFLESEHNYILLRPKTGGEKRERLTPELALAALRNFLKDADGPKSRRMRGLEDAIKRAGDKDNGMQLLYFDRLFKILATGNLSPKLTEMASGEPFHWGKLLGILRLSDGEADWSAAGNHIAGSVYTGYVYDLILAEKFARFYDKVSLLQAPAEQQLRRKAFHDHAYRVLRRAGGEFGTAEVLELLNLRNTPISNLAREQILDGEVDLKVVSRGDAQKIWNSLKNNENSGKPVPVAFYAPAVKNPEGVPLIVVQRQNPNFSAGRKVADAASLAAIVVHEFQHHLDSQTHSYFEPMERLRSEMRAWLEEIAFMVENGIMDDWNKVEPQSPYGFGVYLRNLIDKDYIEGPRDLVVSPGK